MKDLVGKIIARVLISDDYEYLQFELDDGNVIVYRAAPDCCNDVWFSHIFGLQALLHEQVCSVHTMPMIEDAMPTHQDVDVDDVYGWKIITQQGYCDIEMRNSSYNGHYDGALKRVSDEWLQTRDFAQLHFVCLTHDF